MDAFQCERLGAQFLSHWVGFDLDSTFFSDLYVIFHMFWALCCLPDISYEWEMKGGGIFLKSLTDEERLGGTFLHKRLTDEHKAWEQRVGMPG